jgi:hypothetical protein
VSVDFEPVRVDGRRRRIEPIAVAGVVLIALVVAVIKPWEAAETPTPSPRGEVATTPSEAAPSPTPTATVAPEPSAGAEAFWDAIEPVVGVHRDWGVLGVYADTSATKPDGMPIELGGSWSAAPPTPDGTTVVDLTPGDLPVYIVGLTSPPDDPPTDARFWLVRSGGDLEWMATVALPAGSVADRPRLFFRPGDSEAAPWPPGEYRIDVLHGERIDRLTLKLADQRANVPAPSPRPVPERGLVGSMDSDPSAVRNGLFATVDGAGVSLEVASGRPLDETDAWLATARSPDDGVAPIVASAFLPRATGLGVMLTPHADIELAVLRRLAPSPLTPVPPARGGLSGSQGRTPYVVFAAPDGKPLAAGVYALSVSWSDDTGLHATTWHAELLPGPRFNLGA